MPLWRRRIPGLTSTQAGRSAGRRSPSVGGPHTKNFRPEKSSASWGDNLYRGCSPSGCGRHVSYLSFLADGLQGLVHMSPICPFRWMVCRGSYTCLLLVLFGGWSAQAPTCLLPVLLANGLHRHLHILADGLHRPLHVPYLSFWQMVCTGHYTNGADPAPCTLHCLRPHSIPYTLGCPCETSTLKPFGLICGPCHHKEERLHTGTGQDHNSYPCLPLP